MTMNRVKAVVQEINDEHFKKVNERISGVFLFGFCMGIVFSYTGFLGFGCGILTGIVVSKKYSQIKLSTEAITEIFYNMITQAKYIINRNEYRT